jgi:malonate transporter
MSTFLHHIYLSVPPFALVAVGYALIQWGRWPRDISEALTRFVFTIALPAMMFRMMSDFSRLPAVDARLLIAFFGSCLVVFFVGRFVGWRLFKLDGVGQSVFALGGVFSNTVLLGIPLTKATLGDAALPSVALVLVFNALTLWTLVTISVEWARHGSFTVAGFTKMTFKVATNPVIAAIVLGTLLGLTGIKIPELIDAPLAMVAQAAAPMSLIALGAGLAEYGVRNGWRLSVAICVLKILVQPLVVWWIARFLGLPHLETQVVVLLASLPVGVNVYLMSRQFKTMEGPVASSMVISTALSALTTPMILTLI